MDSDHCKIFIGGISWETTEERLRDYFSKYGEVVQTVIMKDRLTGRARGFGFVVFSDPSMVDIALQEKHTIDGRAVEAKKAVPRSEQHNARTNNYNNNDNHSQSYGGGGGGSLRTKKIFVGGLPANLTEEDFKNYFQQFGNITDVVVMYDHNTQRPRGFGFISFDSEDAVENVLQKSFHQLNEKLVEVKRALPKDASPGAASRGAGGYQGYNNSTSNIGGYEGRMDNNRYGQPPPAGRGGFPSYGPTGYGTPSYGPAGYGAVNTGGYGYGNYGMNSYGSAPGAPGYAGAAGGYGSTPVPNTAFGNGPVGAPRNPWGNTGAPGYGNQGNTAGYGTNAGYAAAAPWTASGATVSGAAGQSPSTGNGYANPNYGYGYANNDGTYNSNAAGGYGGPGRGGAAPNYNMGNTNGEQAGTGGPYAVGYGDPHGNSGYSETVWKSGGPDASSAGFVAASSGGYGVPNVDGTVNGPTGYGGYGAAGRQNQRQ